MKSLREQIPNDLFDYVQLTDALAEYGNIRMKIGRLLASGEIIRIKKGLYTFPEYLRRNPVNPAVVANMIYGPSYVSSDYALSYYGMIPETVTMVTSMTTGVSRTFTTPLGVFTYHGRHSADYSIGFVNLDDPCGGYLIAAKEKAIYDKALTDRRFDGADVPQYLLEDLRMDEDMLSHLNKRT